MGKHGVKGPALCARTDGCVNPPDLTRIRHGDGVGPDKLRALAGAMGEYMEEFWTTDELVEQREKTLQTFLASNHANPPEVTDEEEAELRRFAWPPPWKPTERSWLRILEMIRNQRL